MSEDPRIERLFTEEDRLPRTAVDEILRDGARLAPRLAEIVDDPKIWDDEPPRCWAPLHALFLLAAIKPAGSFDVVARGIARAAELFDDLIGDAAPSLLAGYVGPTLDPVRSVLRDPDQDDTLRQDACTALVCAAGIRPELREAVAEELRAAAVDRSGSRDLRATAASHLLGLAEARDREFLASFERNEYFDREYVDEAYERQARAPFPPIVDWLDFYSPDAIAARQRELEEEHVHGGGDLDEILPDEIVRSDPAADVVEAATAGSDEAPPPFRRDLPKVGRNDPCPCGSGAKFKKCCGR